MAVIPGLNSDVYFGDVETPLPNWREELLEDDDNDDLSPEDREAVIGLIGFDPREGQALSEPDDDEEDDEEDTGTPPLKTKSLKAPYVKEGFTGKREDSAGRNRCYQNGALVPCHPGGSNQNPKMQQAQERVQDRKKKKGERHEQASKLKQDQVNKARKEALTKVIKKAEEAGAPVAARADLVKRFGENVWNAIPQPTQKALIATYRVAKAIEHAAMTFFRKGTELAKETAKQNGLSDEKVEKVGKVLGYIDMGLAWTVNIPTTLAATGSMGAAKASGFFPIASLGYVAGSAVTNPYGVLRAAKTVLSKKQAAEHKSLEPAGDSVAKLIQGYNNAGNDDWYTALISSAYDEVQDLDEAIEMANAALEETPEPMVENDPSQWDIDMPAVEDTDEEPEGDDMPTKSLKGIKWKALGDGIAPDKKYTVWGILPNGKKERIGVYTKDTARDIATMWKDDPKYKKVVVEQGEQKLLPTQIKSGFYRDYKEALRQAQQDANATGQDVALLAGSEYGKRGFHIHFASHNDSDYARAEIIKPMNRKTKNWPKAPFGQDPIPVERAFDRLSKEERQGWVMDTADEGPDPVWHLLRRSTQRMIEEEYYAWLDKSLKTKGLNDDKWLVEVMANDYLAVGRPKVMKKVRIAAATREEAEQKAIAYYKKLKFQNIKVLGVTPPTGTKTMSAYDETSGGALVASAEQKSGGQKEYWYRQFSTGWFVIILSDPEHPRVDGPFKSGREAEDAARERARKTGGIFDGPNPVKNKSLSISCFEMMGKYYADVKKDGTVIHTTSAGDGFDKDSAKKAALHWVRKHYPPKVDEKAIRVIPTKADFPGRPQAQREAQLLADRHPENAYYVSRDWSTGKWRIETDGPIDKDSMVGRKTIKGWTDDFAKGDKVRLTKGHLKGKSGVIVEVKDTIKGSRLYRVKLDSGELELTDAGEMTPLAKSLPNQGKKDFIAAVLFKSLAPPRIKEGFTGEREDSLGRNRCYQEGKPVPCAGNEEQAPQKEKPQQEQETDTNPKLPIEQESVGKEVGFTVSGENITGKITELIDDGFVVETADGRQFEAKPDMLTEKKKDLAPAPPGEHIVPPPCCLYDPDPTAVNKETGLVDHARVGVPAMDAPPPPKEIPRLPNLTEKERAVEGRFADAYLENPDGFVEEYKKKRNNIVAKDKNGNPIYEVGDAPNFFNTDDVKQLSPDYNPFGVDKDTNLSAKGNFNLAVHQTANAIAKRAFMAHLDKEFKDLPPDQQFVLVTSGGVASGKGYALGKSKETAELSKIAGAVWDAAGEQNATENAWVLQECKKRGIKTKFAYIHGNPDDNWENPKKGVVERAGGKGRMVDARVYADSYALGSKNFKAFMDRHIDDGDIEFYTFDNSKLDEQGNPLPPEMTERIPEQAFEVDGEKLYAKASKIMEERKDKLKPSVLRGGTIGARVWGKPKQETGSKSNKESI